MKLSERTIKAKAASGECGKPACKTGSHTLHRHHRRHQAIFLGVWSLRRANEQKFIEFCERYNSFAPEDVVVICANHHAEIHMVYDQIIQRDRERTMRPLSKYSWTQAEKLMSKLEAVCVDWLKKPTPGVTSERLEELRARYYYRPGRQARSLFASFVK